MLNKPASTVPEPVPTIKAEGSYKQRPEQPGGIDIPHQDVQVYQALDAKGAPKEQEEHLLPPPETPHAATVASSTPTTPAVATFENLTPPPTVATTATPATVTPSPPVQAVATPAPPPKAAPVASVKATTVSAAPAVKTPPASPAVAKPAPITMSQVIKDVTAQAPPSAPASDAVTTVTTDAVSAAPATPQTGGNAAIQLASLPDQATAQSAMTKLQSQYASVLGSTQLHLVKADLGAKGVYYRVQSQPISEDRAKNLCTAIKANNAGCILVRF
jgi:hypothetical protein